jgi:hypothetical protein
LKERFLIFWYFNFKKIIVNFLIKFFCFFLFHTKKSSLDFLLTQSWNTCRLNKLHKNIWAVNCLQFPIDIKSNRCHDLVRSLEKQKNSHELRKWKELDDFAFYMVKLGVNKFWAACKERNERKKRKVRDCQRLLWRHKRREENFHNFLIHMIS